MLLVVVAGAAELPKENSAGLVCGIVVGNETLGVDLMTEICAADDAGVEVYKNKDYKISIIQWKFLDHDIITGRGPNAGGVEVAPPKENPGVCDVGAGCCGGVPKLKPDAGAAVAMGAMGAVVAGLPNMGATEVFDVPSPNDGTAEVAVFGATAAVLAIFVFPNANMFEGVVPVFPKLRGAVLAGTKLMLAAIAEVFGAPKLKAGFATLGCNTAGAAEVCCPKPNPGLVALTAEEVAV